MQKEHQVYNIDKRASHFYPEITRIGDVRRVEQMSELLKGMDCVVLLAAEHRDDVSPVTDYCDLNVNGMQNVLAAMEANGIRRIVFTSSVAVYGLNKHNPDDTHPADPFNHYGKSMLQAEMELEKWYKSAFRQPSSPRPPNIFLL